MAPVDMMDARARIRPYPLRRTENPLDPSCDEGVSFGRNAGRQPLETVRCIRDHE